MIDHDPNNIYHIGALSDFLLFELIGLYTMENVWCNDRGEIHAVHLIATDLRLIE